MYGQAKSNSSITAMDGLLPFSSTNTINKLNASIPCVMTINNETTSGLECTVDGYRTYEKPSSPSSDNLKFEKNKLDVKNKARRRLFGSGYDHSATKADLASMRQELSQQDRARWGFNFESGHPCRLESGCRYIWERVSAECCTKENQESIISRDYSRKSVTTSSKLSPKTNEICSSLSPINNTALSSNASSPYKLLTSTLNSPKRKPLCDSTDIIMNLQNVSSGSPKVLQNSDLIVGSSITSPSNNRLSISFANERGTDKVKRRLNLGEGSSNNEANKRIKLGNNFSHSSFTNQLLLREEFQQNELLQGLPGPSQQLRLDQASNNCRSIQPLMQEPSELEQEASNISQQQFDQNLQQLQEQQDESQMFCRYKVKRLEADELQNNYDNSSSTQKSRDSYTITSTNMCNRNQEVSATRSNVAVVENQAVRFNAVVLSSNVASSASGLHTPIRDADQPMTQSKISSNRRSSHRKRRNSLNIECHTITEYYPAKKSRVGGTADNQGPSRRCLNL